MAEVLSWVQDAPLVAEEVERRVRRSGAGAVLTFSGVVRDNFDGRSVVALEYESYAEMAVREMEKLRTEALNQWPKARLAMAHRVGRLDVGEPSVIISASAPHRDTVYRVSRFAIDALKKRVPIWKKECFADGSVWKANQCGDPVS